VKLPQFLRRPSTYCGAANGWRAYPAQGFHGAAATRFSTVESPRINPDAQGKYLGIAETRGAGTFRQELAQ
jgi:hypothetical protein